MSPVTAQEATERLVPAQGHGVGKFPAWLSVVSAFAVRAGEHPNRGSVLERRGLELGWGWGRWEPRPGEATGLGVGPGG